MAFFHIVGYPGFIWQDVVIGDNLFNRALNCSRRSDAVVTAVDFLLPQRKHLSTPTCFCYSHPSSLVALMATVALLIDKWLREFVP